MYSNLRRRLLLQRLEERLAPALFTVNTTADTGVGSLRFSINFANSGLALGADTIVFDTSVFSTAQTIALTSGEIAISDHLTITGPATGVTISGSNVSRVLNVSAAGAVVVSMSDLTIANGKATGSGGGIATKGGSIALTRCTVTGNQATGNGGGIDGNTSAVISLTDCTVANNKASANGGGLGVGSSSLTILRSTVSGNSATDGGGLYFAGPVGASGLTIRNSTFSGNSATSDGGGVALQTFSGTLLVQNSTLTANSAAGFGGGVRQNSGAGTISVESSIVQGNFAGTGLEISTSGTVTAKTTAFGTTAGIKTYTNNGGNLIGSSILFGPLAISGGTTQTHALLPGSSGIDAGSNPAALSTDQRGTSPRTFGSAVDMGAFEARPFIVTTMSDNGTGSLRQAVLNANTYAGSDTITFDGAFFISAKTITLTSGHITSTGPIAILGPGAALATVSGNKTSRVFNFNEPDTVSISGLTITNGNSGSANGGGIFIQDANVTLTSCIITNNVTTGHGGGVSTFGGSLVIDRCTIAGNQSERGGGVNGTAFALVTIRDSSIIDNKASFGGGALRANAGVMLVERSTLSGNSAAVFGGGVYSYVGLPAGTGPGIFRDVTISGNTAQFGGGALLFGPGTATFQNSTITGNTSSTKGGGICDYWGKLSLVTESTIIQGNTAPTGPDVFTTGTVTAKNTALGTLNGITTYTNNGGNLIGKSLLLGPLAFNGGPTQTHALLPGSPFINAGSNPASLTTDQRGAGYARTRDGVTDIGAFEYASILVTNALDNGPGSLRQAVLDANASLGYDTITFDSKFFNTSQGITLTSGEILIADPLAIQGPGSALTAVSGNNTFRVFNLNGPGVITVSISGLAIINGKTTGGEFGAGIYSQGEMLTVSDCLVSNNTADGAGGGIASVNAGHLTLERCVVVFNQSINANGGGVDGNLGGQVTFRDCTIANNTAKYSGGAFSGYSDLMLIERSTINGNVANFVGGIDMNGPGPLTVRNSTISGNTALGGNGGGLVAGTMIVQNCTITNNSAATGGGIVSSLVTLENSIVQANFATTGSEVYTTGKVTAKSSALGTIDGITTFTNLGGNLIGTDIKLGPLADNGGPTLTHALLPGSPCINAGTNPIGLTTDQRGGVFARNVNGTDIGAYEFQPGAKVSSVQVNDNSPQRSRVTSLTVTFDSVVTLPTNKADAFQLKRQSDNAVVDLSASTTGNAVTLSFLGGPVEFGSLADGRYTLTVVASQVSGGLLDGNGDGGAGDSYVLIGAPANGLFRLYGDSDGDGTVAANDFIQFRLSLGGNNPIFDFDNDGAVAASDFIQFRLRFGGSV